MFYKILPWIVSAILLVMVVLQFFQLREISNSLEQSNEYIARRFNSFDEQLGRAETKVDLNGELISLLEKNLPKDIKKDIKEGSLEVVAVGKAVVKHAAAGGGKVAYLPSTKSEEAAVIYAGPLKNPSWSFKDWHLSAIFADNTFSYILDQSFEVLLVEAERPGAKPTYLRVWEIDKDGKRVGLPLQVKDFNFVRKKKPDSEFSFLNPKLDLGVRGSTSFSNFDVVPEIGLSVSSYGETKDDLTWRFFRAGLGFDGDKLSVSASPVSYNLGKNLPLVSNVWVSPSYVWSGSHGIGIGVGGSL